MYELAILLGRSGRGLGGDLGVGALQDPLGGGLFSETELSLSVIATCGFSGAGGGFAGVLPIAPSWTRCAACGNERAADAA
jgi:hypothetical protein